MSDILNSFAIIAPFLNDLTINDTGVYVTDREKYLAIVHAKTFQMSVKEGDIIPKGTVLRECMESGRTIKKKVSAEIFGFPYISCATPIWENGEVVGGVVFASSIQKEAKVLQAASSLSQGLAEVAVSSEGIAAGSEKLVKVNDELMNLSNVLNGYIRETDSVLKVIENFARETNLLGLNASIEASRAGSAGKGFSVIANETRRLALDTSSSAKKIEEIFGRIKTASSDQESIIENINNVITTQMESIKSVNDLIRSLSIGVDTLVSDTQDLSDR